MPIAWDGAYCPFVHSCDDSRRPDPWRLPKRRLAHYLLVTSLEGPEELVVDGRSVAVPEGATYLIRPGVLHDLSAPRGNRPAWVHFDVQWDPKRVHHPHAAAYDSELGARAKLLQPQPVDVWGLDLPVLTPSELWPIFADGIGRIIAAWQRGGRIGVLEAAHLLGGLMLNWVGHARRGDAGDASDAEARVARAEAVAARSLGSGFGVDEFAAASGWSRSRFCAVFTALRGRSPGDWLRGERMRAATSLLARPELTVSAVGSLVGYADATVFGRVFRAHHGRSPGAWRRRRAPTG